MAIFLQTDCGLTTISLDTLEKTFTYKNCIAKVHIPELSEEERKKRMEAIKRAAANLLKEGVQK